MYQPTETEINYAIEKIDAAYKLSNKMSTVAFRLKTLLEDMEQRSESSDASDALTVITNGHELSALVDWLIEQPDNLDLMHARCALGGEIDIDGDGDDSTAPADDDDESDSEPVNPGSSGMLMALGKLYEAQSAIHAMLHAIRNMEITETIAVDTDAHTCAALRAANEILDAANEIEAAAGVNFHYGLLTDEDRRQLRSEMWGAIG